MQVDFGYLSIVFKNLTARPLVLPARLVHWAARNCEVSEIKASCGGNALDLAAILVARLIGLKSAVLVLGFTIRFRG
jgi:hypothetical protein